MKKIITILHDIMEHLNESPHDYQNGSLIITHDMDRIDDYPAGIIEIEYDDIHGNHYALGSVYRKEGEHDYED